MAHLVAFSPQPNLMYDMITSGNTLARIGTRVKRALFDTNLFHPEELDIIINDNIVRSAVEQFYNTHYDKLHIIDAQYIIDEAIERLLRYFYSEKVDRIKKNSQTIWKLFSDEYGAYQTPTFKPQQRRPDPFMIFTY